ncbi:helix-turn-helix transcriptional regulator [Candidatus Sumerlaeota bacterium]|nr:helix-turn-helix transcriptional regulator [Candidatus Sumerlaeota bacterium]
MDVDVLKRLRRVIKQGTPQSRVAREADLTPAAISKLRAGKHGLRLTTAIRLEKALSRIENEKREGRTAA